MRTLVAVAAVFLASAPAAAAQSAPAYARLSVVRTITWIGWSAGPDGTYRATICLRPYVFEVPYVAGSLSASSNASASRR